MGDVKQFFELDWKQIIIGIILIMVVTIFVWEKGSWLLNKLIQKIKERERLAVDHKSIEELSSAVNKISDSQDEIGKTLKNTEKVVNGIKEDIELLKADSESAKSADKQLLADRLLQASRYFLNTLNGIPEEEYGSFKQMYKLYVERGDGNEELTAKVEYCLNELDVIPSNQNYIVKKSSPLSGKIIM